MADTVAITAGSGTTIGTDEVTIGGTLQHVQRVKLVDGTDGGTGLIGGDATNGLDVDVTRVGGGPTTSDLPLTANPVTIGGRASNAIPTAVSADGDVVDAWFTRFGNQAVFLTANDGSVLSAQNAVADGLASSAAGIVVTARGTLYNGSTWDRPRSVESVSAAPNVDTGIMAVGHGPGFDRKTNPTGVAATSTANAVEVLVNGADSVSFHVTTIGTTPGSMIIETTGDDTNWATSGAVIKLGSQETFIEGAFVPAVNDIYLVRTTGVRRVRYRVNAAYASGTATVKVTSSIGSPIIKVVEMAPAPHKIGYAITGKTAQYTTTQTSTTIGPTVSSTQRLVVTSIQIQAGGTTAGELQVYFGTGAYSRGTNLAIFDGEFAPSATSKPGFAMAPSVPWMGAADEELKVTDSAAINKLTVTIWYYLVNA